MKHVPCTRQTSPLIHAKANIASVRSEEGDASRVELDVFLVIECGVDGVKTTAAIVEIQARWWCL